MSEQTQIYKPKKYFVQFDGGRGLLVFSIFIFHLHFYYFRVSCSLPYFTLHCFYVASAYLITTILLRDKKKAQSFKVFFKNFYAKRILRIFPVYFGYIFFVITVGILLKVLLHKDVLHLITELKKFGILLFTFTYNFKDLIEVLGGSTTVTDSYVFPHLWSISMEEQFYIIIPFLIYFINERWLMRIAIAIILIFPIIRILSYHEISSRTDDYYKITFTLVRCSLFQFDAFFYGVILALMPKIKLTKVRKFFYLFVLIIVIQEIINGFIVNHKFSIGVIDAMTRYDFYSRSGAILYIDTLINICCVFFLYLIFNNENEFPLLHKNELVESGKVSYGSYVYQYLFIIPVNIIFRPFLVKYLPIWMAESILIIPFLFFLVQFAIFSYYKFELKFINMKTKFK